jgi:hypothetical protein
MKTQKLKKLRQANDYFLIDKMRKLNLLLLAFCFVILSCKEDVVTKPKNLIERDKMVAIIYDLSVLEAAKSQTSGIYHYPKSSQFLKEKYKVDSLTFAQSSQYYASDMKEYKKMYDEVKARLQTEYTKLNGVKPIKETTEQGVLR